jgi:hypothetical protein
MSYKYGALVSIRNEQRWIKKCLTQISCTPVEVISITRGLTSWRNGYTELDNTTREIRDWQVVHRAHPPEILYQEVQAPESDEAQRNICLQALKDVGCDFVFIIDPDEFYHQQDLDTLFAFCDQHGPEKVGQVHIYAHSYWRGMRYRCGTERFGPVMMRCDADSKFHYIRDVCQDTQHTLDMFLHHMSAVHTDKEMEEKIKGWSHSHEVQDGWLERVWHGWKKDRRVTNLHPVSPGLWPCVKKVDRIEIPAILHDHPLMKRDTL